MTAKLRLGLAAAVLLLSGCDVSEPPALINWLVVLTGISGITLTTIIGWMLGDAPPVERPSSRQERREETRRRPQPQQHLSFADHVRRALFNALVRPDMSMSDHLARVFFVGLGFMLVVGGWVYAGTEIDKPLMRPLHNLVSLGIPVLGLVFVFFIARLRWRMRYENWRRSQDYSDEDT